MDMKGKTVLITGAGRGIGRATVEALLAEGAGKVYGADVTAPEALSDRRFVPVVLDVTDAAAVTAAAVRCADTEVLINNAGIISWLGAIQTPDLAHGRREMEVNFWGMLTMCRAFATVLAKNGGGAIANVLSLVARINSPNAGIYCATKAAAWSITQAVRAELRRQRTLVVAVFPGLIDTAMTTHLDLPKSKPVDVAAAILRALKSDLEDIYIGADSDEVLRGLMTDPKAVERQFAALAPLS